MEFISFANLITLGIVIFMLGLYRYFDKNNRTLEKVKRYTDKEKENLSGFIDEKTQEIRNLSIDMQVNLKTAKEILNRVGTIEVELKNKASSMDDLHDKVNKYDTLIRELNSATIIVEENLKRIHDESAFVEKVGKQVKTAQVKMDHLEKQIPHIREEINKQNSNDLRQLKETITRDVTQRTKVLTESVQGVEKKVKDFSGYVSRLEDRRDTMEQESIKKFDSVCAAFETRMLKKKAEVAKTFKDEMSGHLKDAHAERDEYRKSIEELIQGSQFEITGLEDRMLKHLIEFKKDIEQAELNFKTNLSKVVESGKNLEHDIFIELREKIKQDADKVHGEVGKRLIDFSKEVDIRNNEIITILGKTKQNTEVWKTGIDKRIDKIKDELKTYFLNSKAEIEADISAFSRENQDTRQAYEAQLGEFITTSENKMKELEAEYERNIKEIDRGFSAFKDDYTNRLSEIDNKVDTEKEQMILSFREKMNAMEKQKAIRFEEMKKDFEEIDGLGDDIKFRMKNIKKDLQECSCDLLGKIDEFKHTFSDDLTNASAEVETTVMNRVDERIAEYEQNATYRFDKLEQVQTDIESLEKGLRELMERKKEELKSDFAHFIAHMDEKKKEEREYTNSILSEIRKEVEKLEHEVHNLKEKAYENVSAKLKVFEDDFFADLKVRSETMEESIHQWHQSVKETLDSIESQYKEERTTLAEHYKNEYVKIEDKYKKDRITIEEGYNHELQTGMTDLEKRTSALFIAFKKAWKEKLTGEIVAYKSEFNKTAREYKDEVKSIITDIKTNFAAQRDTIIKAAEEKRKVVKGKIDTLDQRVDGFEKEFAGRTGTILQDFENEYNQKQNEFTRRLRELQGEFEAKIKDFKNTISESTTFVSDAREAQKDELKGMEEKLVSLKEELGQMAEKALDRCRDEYDKLQDNFLHQSKEFEDTMNKKLAGFELILNKNKNNFLNQSKEFEDAMGKKLTGFEQALNKNQDKFLNQSKEFEDTMGKKLAGFEQTLNRNQDKFLNQSMEFEETMAKNFAGFEQVLKKKQNDFLNQSKIFDDTMGKKISGFEEAVDKKITGFEDTSSKRISSFEQTIKSSQEKFKQTQEKVLQKIDDEFKALTGNLKDIERQQQNFVSQTKLFERADNLKLALKTEMDDIRKDMQKLEPVSKKLNALEIELAKMNKLSEEMYTKTTRYAAEKRRIDNMEKNFNQLLKISADVDEKLENVTAANDSLQEIKIRIRELGELGTKVQAQYDRLEKKKEVLETTTIGVDESFRHLEELEKEIKRIETDVESLPTRVLSIDRDIKFLCENKPKADSAVEKLQSLDSLMTDIEERTEKLTNARDWLARTETRLETLGKSTQDQLKLLKALIKDDGGNGKKIQGAPKQDKREMIIKLARQGWSGKEISKATNTSLGEVELVLELEPKKR